MMAEVGGIVKVSGSRIATPLAPPRPGSTPMMTPSRMPTSIKARLYQDERDLEAADQRGNLFHDRSPFPSFPRAAGRAYVLPAASLGSFCARWYTMCQLQRSVQYGIVGTDMSPCVACDVIAVDGLPTDEALAYGIPNACRARQRGVWYTKTSCNATVEVRRGRHPAEDRARSAKA